MKKRMIEAGILIVLLLVLCNTVMIRKQTSEKKVTELEGENEHIELYSSICVEENGFGTSSINVSKFRNSAVVMTDKGEVTAYFHADGTAYLALVGEDKIYKVQILDAMDKDLLGDGHCSINIGYYNNKIYYAYGSHVTNGYYGSIDLENFYTESYTMSAKIDELLTYPSFYNIGEEFWFVYRADNDNYWYYLDLTNSEEFDFADAKMICYGNTQSGLYLNDLDTSEDGSYAAIPFVERYPIDDEEGHVHNDGVYLIWSDDGLKSWKSLRNEELSLPIGIDDTEKVVSVGMDANLMNQESTYVTDKGEVYFTRITDDADGIPQIYLTKFDTNTRKSISWQVTKNDTDFDLLGKGTLRLPLSRSQVVVSEKEVHVIYRQEDSIIVASAFIGGTAMTSEPSRNWSYAIRQVNGNQIMMKNCGKKKIFYACLCRRQHREIRMNC